MPAKNADDNSGCGCLGIVGIFLAVKYGFPFLLLAFREGLAFFDAACGGWIPGRPMQSWAYSGAVTGVALYLSFGEFRRRGWTAASVLIILLLIAFYVYGYNMAQGG